MQIWQAILYALVGGICEVLPVSFFAHALVLQNALNLTPLWSAEGYFVRAAIFLGVALGISSSYRAEFSRSARELRRLVRPRRRERFMPTLRRSVLLGLIALIPTLLSFLYLSAAESIRRLPVVACFFALNGLMILIATREKQGMRIEKDLLLSDALLLGTSRALSVFPGLSPFSAAVCVGRVEGLATGYHLRFSYSLSALYCVFGFLYFLVRGIAAGGAFPALAMLFALMVSAVSAYAAIAYFRYLMHKDRLRFFAFYNWDAALVVLVLALINS